MKHILPHEGNIGIKNLLNKNKNILPYEGNIGIIGVDFFLGGVPKQEVV